MATKYIKRKTFIDTVLPRWSSVLCDTVILGTWRKGITNQWPWKLFEVPVLVFRYYWNIPTENLQLILEDHKTCIWVDTNLIGWFGRDSSLVMNQNWSPLLPPNSSFLSKMLIPRSQELKEEQTLEHTLASPFCGSENIISECVAGIIPNSSYIVLLRVSNKKNREPKIWLPVPSYWLGTHVSNGYEHAISAINCEEQHFFRKEHIPSQRELVDSVTRLIRHRA